MKAETLSARVARIEAQYARISQGIVEVRDSCRNLAGKVGGMEHVLAENAIKEAKRDSRMRRLLNRLALLIENGHGHDE